MPTSLTSSPTPLPSPYSAPVSKTEAIRLSTEWFGGDELAASVFVGKYALTDPVTGDVLEPTPDLMHRRLAREFARVEARYKNPVSEDQIFDLFKGFNRIIPQGSPMSAIGNPFSVQSLGNCFVLTDLWDSYSSIMQHDEQLVQLAKRRAGVGMDLSALRPAGSPTKNAAKTSTGVVSFMERFSNSIREVAQSGRRGALLLSLSIHHPDIRGFITAKRDPTKITGANISVKATNEFMQAVQDDTEYELRFPVTSQNVVEKVRARDIWNLITENACFSGDPGVFFWDRACDYSPAHCYGAQHPDFANLSSNPCGEIIMGVDSCRLLLLNAYGYVRDRFMKSASFDWTLFSEDAKVAQRLMDDLVDLELEAIDRILAKIASDPEPDEVKTNERTMWERFRANAEKGRRTGLGLTGIADAMAGQGILYDSREGIEFTSQLYKRLAESAYESSVGLAEERGAFPIWSRETEKGNAFLEVVLGGNPALRKRYEKSGRRNIASLTTAPCGSVSIEAQTSSGIEPVFRLSYTRRKKINPGDTTLPDFVDNTGEKWKEFEVFHHGLRHWMEVTGETDIAKSPYHHQTSAEIDWKTSVDIQAAAQRYIDHSISKTHNLPRETSQEVVADLYWRSYLQGNKGVTVYREGSKSGVLVSKEEKQIQDGSGFTEHHAPKRPQSLSCEIHQVQVQGEKWTVFVGLFDGKPYEVIGGLATQVKIPRKVRTGRIVKHNGPENPKARYDLHYGDDPEDETIIQDIANIWENPTHAAFTRTLSLALRHGTPVQYVVEQLVKGSEKEDDMWSFSRCVSRVLKTYIKDGTKVGSKGCSQCQATDTLVYQEGCVSCTSCGWSKCS